MNMAPHPQRLTVTRRGWALTRPITTARGVETTADVVIAEIFDGDGRGRGECVPVPRYGESIDSVVYFTSIEGAKSAQSRTNSRPHVGGNRLSAKDCAVPGLVGMLTCMM
jgi:hypothetical protein